MKVKTPLLILFLALLALLTVNIYILITYKDAKYWQCCQARMQGCKDAKLICWHC